MKQLKKSNKKIIAGVCGGVAECLKIDPTVVRLIVCIIALFSKGVVLILYLVAAFVMPEADSVNVDSDADVENLKSANIESGEKTFNSEKSDNVQTAPHTDDEFNSFFKK